MYKVTSGSKFNIFVQSHNNYNAGWGGGGGRTERAFVS